MTNVQRRHTLDRTAFTTSRALEYFSEKELTLQTGHEPERWPDVVLKELLDNSLDACEDADIPPEITVTIAKNAITVFDNGPGIPAAVVTGVLDYTSRISTKDAYVSPSRGSQGNALKTVLAIPYVLGGCQPQQVILAGHRQRHTITISLDRIEQLPVLTHAVAADVSVKTGTRITVPIACLESADGDDDDDVFLPLVAAYSLFNPHATFTLRREGEKAQRFVRTATSCRKWKPSDPTSPHWYTPAQLRTLMAAYVTSERRGGPALTVRDFIGQFRGLSSTVKRKTILARLPTLASRSLSACVKDNDIDEAVVAKLLAAMCRTSTPIRPTDLGVLGQPHLQTWLAAHGGVAATISYKRIADVDETTGLPFVFEFAFGARQDEEGRRLFVGLNSAPTLVDPFRMLKASGQSLGSLLSAQYLGPEQPVTCIAHLSCPHLRFTDRGKSSLEGL